jgi:hypothetical protein
MSFTVLTCVRRALVLYNAAVAHAPADQNPVLVVGGQQMAAFVHSPQGRAVLPFLGRMWSLYRAPLLSNRSGHTGLRT